jgi:hypothetical protein
MGAGLNNSTHHSSQRTSSARRNVFIGIYLRLVYEPDADSKRLAFERALAELKAAQGESAG